MSVLTSRKSIRKYKETPVSEEMVNTILRAAMSAPSAGNQQPWEFIVLRDHEVMKAITEVHPYSKMLLQANVAIVVCGDASKEVFSGFWVQDCSAATENILLSAEENGLGAVWLGVYPDSVRVEAIKTILNLPTSVTPLCIVPIGYPDEVREPVNRFNPERIHLNRW